MRVYTNSEVDYDTDTPIEAASWASHPNYEAGPWFAYDVGIVILEAPVAGVTEFGELPEVDSLDAYKTKRG